jgi:hypothetical protein
MKRLLKANICCFLVVHSAVKEMFVSHVMDIVQERISAKVALILALKIKSTLFLTTSSIPKSISYPGLSRGYEALVPK